MFAGAFLIALIYSTKSEQGPMVTIGQREDSAAISSVTLRDSATPLVGPVSPSTIGTNTLTVPPASLPLADLEVEAPAAGGSSSPAVGPREAEELRAQRLVIPVAGVAAKDLIDSFNDMRGGTRRHNALDIMAPRNTPVVSATAGKVLKLHNSTAGGLTIYASDQTSRFVLMYGHLESFRPGLKEGSSVQRGEIIGFVGTSGNANPAGPHLHFQVTRNDNMKEWWKGTPLNPFPAFRPR